jgi:hypothetical protein
MSASPRVPVVPASATAWTPAVRVAFRFSVVYLGLYAAVTQILGGVLILPNAYVPALGPLPPLRDFTFWLAGHLGAEPPLDFAGTSGDTLFHWVQNAWVLAAAVVATAAWSMVDSRQHYAALHAWFRVFVRFALAAQMFYFGMAKVIPTQFRPPALTTLVERVGNLSLSDLLWVFVGASTPYQVLTGVVEVAGGLLLIVPQTATLGALVCFVGLLQVFALNMTYDVGLKQISFHLVLMSLFLLAPDAARLANVLVLNRPAPPSTVPPLCRTRRANCIAAAVQLAFGLYLLGIFTNTSLRWWYAPDGPGAPRSALYGIWNVDRMSIDGELRNPDANDYDRRWRRVIFDAADHMAVQRTDDSFARYGTVIDERTRTLTLTKGRSRIWRSTFTYKRPAPGRLVLDGVMDGSRITVQLSLVPLDTFRLRHTNFRWVR